MTKHECIHLPGERAPTGKRTIRAWAIGALVIGTLVIGTLVIGTLVIGTLGGAQTRTFRREVHFGE